MCECFCCVGWLVQLCCPTPPTSAVVRVRVRSFELRFEDRDSLFEVVSVFLFPIARSLSGV